MNHAFALVSALTFAASAAACQRNAQQEMPPMPVVVATPVSQTMVDWDAFSGRFEPSKEVEVRARTSGYVESVNFRDGQYVNQGDLLFTLDARPAEAAFGAAKAQALQAKSEFDRAEKLVAEKAISQQEFDAARATLAQADAAAKQRELDVEFTKITAPMSGMVSFRRVDPGNIIAGGTSQGDLLTTIVATNPIYFTFDASEAVLLKYQRQSRSGRGAPVKVKLQDESDFKWPGTLDFADNGIDRSSGAVRLRAVIPNRNNFIRPGMFGAARVVGSQSYAALLVPDTAISANGARKVVLTVAPDGTVAPKPVELGPLDGSLRVIRSGITAQDQVIIDGVQRAFPGAKVSPQKGEIKQTQDMSAAPPPALAAPAVAASPASELRR